MSNLNEVDNANAAKAMRVMLEESAHIQEIVERYVLSARVQIDAMEQTLLRAQRANEELKREMLKFGILPTEQ